MSYEDMNPKDKAEANRMMNEIRRKLKQHRNHKSSETFQEIIDEAIHQTTVKTQGKLSKNMQEITKIWDQ